MKTTDIANEIARLSPLELDDLTAALMEHNISATLYYFGVVPIVRAVNNEYDVVMTRSGSRKLLVVKTVKEVLGLGLRDAKHLVDDVPCTIKEFATRDEAEAISSALEAAGARITVNPIK